MILTKWQVVGFVGLAALAFASFLNAPLASASADKPTKCDSFSQNFEKGTKDRIEESIDTMKAEGYSQFVMTNAGAFIFVCGYR